MASPIRSVICRQWRLLLLLAACYLVALPVNCESRNGISITPTYTSTSSISTSTSNALFGVRGGGFFGFGRSSKSSGGGGDDDNNNHPHRRFPALSQEEIEEILNIPVFGLTDATGNGVILSESGDNIFHFFFSKHMADVALKAVTSANQGAPELKGKKKHKHMMCAHHGCPCVYLMNKINIMFDTSIKIIATLLCSICLSSWQMLVQAY